MKNKIKIKGIIKSFQLAGHVTAETRVAGFNVLDLIRKAIRFKDNRIIDFLKDQGLVLKTTYKENIIVTVGRSVLAERLAGGTTYSGEINYGAVGTGVSPVPANGDTTLLSEQYRKVTASQSFSDNIAYVDFFYEKTDFNTDVIGSITEFGNFIDGSAGADTGQLWSYIATGGWSKDANTSLFVSCEYTIT